MKKIVKALKITRLIAIGWIAKHSRCLSMRWGLIGIMGATVIGGPNKGIPLGVALALDELRKN
jgi:hypothetical protein